MKRKSLPAGYESRAYDVEVRADQTDESKKIRGHAAVFNQLSEDLGGFREQIAPGAFADAIKHDDVRALFNHSPDHVLGRNKAGTLRLREDKTGLQVEIDPPDTQQGRDVVTLIERGDVSQMSFGFVVLDEEWNHEDKNAVLRTIKKVRLYDVSPVTFPAYPQTDVAVRKLEQGRGEIANKAIAKLNLRRRRLASAMI